MTLSIESETINQAEWDARKRRIAELEAALDEIRNAGYALSRGRNGLAATMCVPIGAWSNAMRILNNT